MFRVEWSKALSKGGPDTQCSSHCTHPPPCSRTCNHPPPRSRGPQLEPFVATSLIQLLCRMTKLGWFEDDAYRGLADEARNFLEKGTAVRHGGDCFACLQRVACACGVNRRTRICACCLVPLPPVSVHPQPRTCMRMRACPSLGAGRLPAPLPAGPAHPQHAGVGDECAHGGALPHAAPQERRQLQVGAAAGCCTPPTEFQISSCCTLLHHQEARHS